MGTKMIIFILLFFSLSSIAQVPSYTTFYSRPFLNKMFSYYPTHETLDRIVQAVLKRERGAYISFGNRDIRSAYFMRQTFGLNGKNIFKALPFPCRDSRLSIQERTACINDSEMCYQKIVKPVLAFWGGRVEHLYACNALLASIDQDIHYSARFIRLLKNVSHYLVISDKSKVYELFNNDSIIDSKGRSAQDIFSEFQKRVTGAYTVIFLAAGVQGHLLVPWLLEKNCFVFDCGDIFDSLDENTFVKLKQKVNANIKILYTAAILNHRQEERQAEYEKNIKILNSFWYEPYIVEACSGGPTFFNEIAHHICYTQSNLQVRNKGVNEVRSIRKGLEQFKFDDNDMVIKITGRYFFKNEFLLRMIEDNPEVDGFILMESVTHFACSGCFALRYKYFKRLLKNINIEQMERYWIDFERIVIDYARLIEKNESAHIKYLDELGVQALVDNSILSHW
jgi:hypothetical protein